MKILQITAGTGNFYCGVCLRDHALVKTLRGLGHDAMLMPVYLPHVIEEPVENKSEHLFLGGLNVYLQQKYSLFRKTPAWVDGLFDSPALLRFFSRRAGSTRASELGELTISMLRGEEGRQVKEIRKLMAWLKTHFRPDVVVLSNALLVGLTRPLKTELQVPVVCTLQGEDGFLDALPQPHCDEAWKTLIARSLEVDRFIAVSHYFGEVMERRLGIPRDRVDVVYNGISLEGFEPAENPPDPPVLGYLARMCAAKGLHILVDAFIELKKRDRIKGLKLRVAGAKTECDEAFVSDQQKKLANAGLASSAEFLPNLDRKAKQDFLRSLTIFSVPANYGEAFGLYLLESLACGVPVVQPNLAAFPELVQATGGGATYQPNEPAPLADAIEELFQNPAKMKKCSTRGREVVKRDFTVIEMAEGVERVLDKLVRDTTTVQRTAIHRTGGIQKP